MPAEAGIVFADAVAVLCKRRIGADWAEAASPEPSGADAMAVLCRCRIGEDSAEAAVPPGDCAGLQLAPYQAPPGLLLL